MYNEEAGTMDVLIPADSPLGLFAHELKHAYQFEKGELSAGPVHGGMGNFLYDFTDEKANMNEARCLDIMYRIGKVETPIKAYPVKV